MTLEQAQRVYELVEQAFAIGIGVASLAVLTMGVLTARAIRP